MTQLVIPHFLLGLGIGAVDAALVPLLAALVDSRQSTHYVSVYAMQQMAVSLAYSLGPPAFHLLSRGMETLELMFSFTAGPVIGGEMVRAIGFPWLMRVVGVINVLYSPAVIILDGLFAKVLSQHRKSPPSSVKLILLLFFPRSNLKRWDRWITKSVIRWIIRSSLIPMMTRIIEYVLMNSHHWQRKIHHGIAFHLLLFILNSECFPTCRTLRRKLQRIRFKKR